jgi:hypothetical protein
MLEILCEPRNVANVVQKDYALRAERQKDNLIILSRPLFLFLRLNDRENNKCID